MTDKEYSESELKMKKTENMTTEEKKEYVKKVRTKSSFVNMVSYFNKCNEVFLDNSK